MTPTDTEAQISPRDLSPQALDQILGLQLSVAWAGEALSEPPRLGWWRTDLVDAEGGAGLLQDLLPQTWAWAALQAVRRAAIAVDARARRQMADRERVRTLFHLGFQVDEKLEERLRFHKKKGGAPHDALSFLMPLDDAFDRERWESALAELGNVEARLVPDGRELQAIPADPIARARSLTAALLPLADSWPAPFFRLGDEELEA